MINKYFFIHIERKFTISLGNCLHSLHYYELFCNIIELCFKTCILKWQRTSWSSLKFLKSALTSFSLFSRLYMPNSFNRHETYSRALMILVDLIWLWFLVSVQSRMTWNWQLHMILNLFVCWYSLKFHILIL